ncbi:MAG: hypothetical protein IKW95_06580 [Lachnospiraceae bacterium]|nr:hypothetical protein [Lachnospiraceae bacterium]
MISYELGSVKSPRNFGFLKFRGLLFLVLYLRFPWNSIKSRKKTDPGSYEIIRKEDLVGSTSFEARKTGKQPGNPIGFEARKTGKPPGRFHQPGGMKNGQAARKAQDFMKKSAGANGGGF